MSNDRGSTGYRVTIAGGVDGQVAVGHDIQQSRVDVRESRPTEDEVAELRQAFVELRAQIADAASVDTRDAAIERVGELEEAVISDDPDLTTMEYVKGWFAKHLPKLAGAVTGVILNPIVGKLVAAGGDALAAEFRQRFEHA